MYLGMFDSSTGLSGVHDSLKQHLNPHLLRWDLNASN